MGMTAKVHLALIRLFPGRTMYHIDEILEALRAVEATRKDEER